MLRKNHSQLSFVIQKKEQYRLIFVKNNGLLALFLSIIIFSNCTSFSATREVKKMSIANPGLVIEATDKSFVLKSGEQFNTPFFTVKERGTKCDLPTTVIGWIFWSPFTLFLGPTWAIYCAATDKVPYDDMMVHYNYPGNSYYEKYNARWAIKNGGRKIKITSPAGKTYEGVIMIFPILEDANGPITRSYEINIPSTSFVDASDGKIAVVYEPYKGGGDHKGWIIWLSDKPLD